MCLANALCGTDAWLDTQTSAVLVMYGVQRLGEGVRAARQVLFQGRAKVNADSHRICGGQSGLRQAFF
jgi:hypothetical protein